MEKSRQNLCVLLLLITMLIWAGSFIAIKISLLELKPCNLAFYRFAIATPLLLLFIYASGKLQLPNRKDIPAILLLALTGVTMLYIVQFIALMYTTATNSSILINTSAIFVALMSIFAGESLTKTKILGLFISFIGIMLIFSNGKIEFFTSKTFLGDILMIFDGFLWAIYTVIGKNMLKRYNPYSLTFYAFLAGTIMLFPFAAAEGIANITSLKLSTWISVLYLSVLCSVVAYIIWYYALTVMDATKVAVFVYIIPLFTAIMAFIILKEQITQYTALGGLLIMLGVYLVERS